jgi:hypothetical protein
MPEDRSVQIDRLLRRAVRRLPRDHRATFQATWQSELSGIQTDEERLQYVQDLRAGIPKLCRELDPEGAYIERVIQTAGATGVGCLLLSFQGVAPELLQLSAGTIAAGVVLLLFTHLTAKCVLITREVRRVWWRLVLNLLLTVCCGYVALADFAWWSALHPQVFPLMLLCVIAGIRIARRFHQPRPVLAR